MKTIKLFLICIIVIFSLTSCATSKSVIAHNADLSKYSYVVFGKEHQGDRVLDDLMLLVENEIAQTSLQVVSPQEAYFKIAEGEHVLSPLINIQSEKWDGGHTYITITFYDYATNQSIIVVKSSGIGLSISHDQEIALDAIKRELIHIFGEF